MALLITTLLIMAILITLNMGNITYNDLLITLINDKLHYVLFTFISKMSSK